MNFCAKNALFKMLIGCIGADYDVTKICILQLGDESSGYGPRGNSTTCYPWAKSKFRISKELPPRPLLSSC
jgi:hypothetical protein